MSDELKPCPFCGALEDTLAIVYEGYSVDSRFNSRLKCDFRVKCFRCGTISGKHPDEKNAIAAWNERDQPNKLPDWIRSQIFTRMDKIDFEVAVKQMAGDTSNDIDNLRCMKVMLHWVLLLKKEEK